jgi:NADPH:quinone reductase-like Zn-dependent oxidoreductase
VAAGYAPIPPSPDFAGAAGLPVAVETAVRTLDLLGVGAGSTVVINGAADAVGSAAVQIAVARGARVIGTASPGNHEYLRSFGAELTTYGDGLAKRLRELEADRFTLPVAQTFPLEQIAEAHRLSETDHVRGKLVLLVS